MKLLSYFKPRYISIALYLIFSLLLFALSKDIFTFNNRQIDFALIFRPLNTPLPEQFIKSTKIISILASTASLLFISTLSNSKWNYTNLILSTIIFSLLFIPFNNIYIYPLLLAIPLVILIVFAIKNVLKLKKGTKFKLQFLTTLYSLITLVLLTGLGITCLIFLSDPILNQKTLSIVQTALYFSLVLVLLAIILLVYSFKSLFFTVYNTKSLKYPFYITFPVLPLFFITKLDFDTLVLGYIILSVLGLITLIVWNKFAPHQTSFIYTLYLILITFAFNYQNSNTSTILTYAISVILSTSFIVITKKQLSLLDVILASFIISVQSISLYYPILNSWLNPNTLYNTFEYYPIISYTTWISLIFWVFIKVNTYHN